MKNNSEVRQTNIGKAKFCYISEPDTQFDSKGIYHTSIEFNKADAEPEIKAILEVIQKKIAEIHKGGGFGSIVGRNSFQRPREEGVALMKEIMTIYNK